MASYSSIGSRIDRFMRTVATWGWWCVAAGLLFAAAALAAMSALSGQLGMMHPPGQEGFGPQGLFSTSHLRDAVASWKAFWNEAPSALRAFASGEEVAKAWFLIDLA